MPRPLRIEFSGARYHVINRGNYRRSLFEGKGAAEAFERALAEAAVRFGWRVHAYVVMGNHFHLAVEIAEPNLSAGMKWLQGTWIRRHNALRGLVGRPFQGRYKALLVEPGDAFGQVCHYIHLNPVRARLVAPDQAVAHRWGSLPKFVSPKRPGWLQPETVLHAAGGLRDTPAGWKKYLAYLEFLAADDGAKRELMARRMSRGWCVGTDAFKQEMRREAVKRGADFERFAGLEPEAVQAERDRGWETQLRALARRAKIDLAGLPAPKSHPHKAVLAAAMKQSTSVSNAWLAQRLAMGPPASASQFARRWMLREEGRTAVADLLAAAGG
ncbi:MAG: transposase [Opitutaceae bacterium]|nr:transposase [Opitutaceae bacterium]